MTNVFEKQTKRLSRWILVACFFSFYAHASAQWDNQLLEDQTLRAAAENGSRLQLSVLNLNFCKNNEYFNNIAAGYTLFGSQLQPTLIYKPSPRLTLQGGIFLSKDFGNKKFSAVSPVWTVQYEAGASRLIFGNLKGSVNHRLIEPLYNFENLLNNRMESGFQYLLHTRFVDLDTWVNWLNMIYFQSPVQEQIQGGLSMNLKLVQKQRFTLQIPIQATIKHKGGQIDTTNIPLTTVVNGAVGAVLTWSFGHSSFFNKIALEGYQVFFRDNSPQKQLAFSTGNGVLLNFGCYTRYIDVVTSYWKGKQFIAPFGAPIYQSISQYPDKSSYTEPRRELLFIRIGHNFKINDHFSIVARLEPIYDLQNSILDYSYGLYFNFQQNISLLK